MGGGGGGTFTFVSTVHISSIEFIQCNTSGNVAALLLFFSCELSVKHCIMHLQICPFQTHSKNESPCPSPWRCMRRQICLICHLHSKRSWSVGAGG